MAQAIFDGSGAKAADKRGNAELGDDIDVIKEHTRETVALLRQLIEMLLPKGDADKPKLEDLIAALVAQQGRILAIVGELRVDMSSVLDVLTPTDESKSRKQPPTNGGLRL